MKNEFNESVGVPRNIEKSSDLIFDFLISKIKEEKGNIVNTDENYVFTSTNRLKISEYTIKNIEVTLNFYVSEDIKEIDIVKMGVRSNIELDDETYRLINRKTNDVNLVITLAVPEEKIKFSDILKYFYISETQIISSLNHELMHAYSDYKTPSESTKDRAKYIAYSSSNFDLPPFRDFLYKLYFSSSVENIVRPSEVNAIMKKGGVRKENFINFLLSNKTYKEYKEINNFSLVNFKLELSKYMDKIDKILYDIGESNIYSQSPDDEKINRVLEVLYITMSNKILENYSSLLTSDFFESLFGVQGKKAELFNKFANEYKRYENNPLGYYEYEEKKFKEVSSKMLKKLSKLYSLIDEKDSINNWEIHSKINKKTQIESEFKY